MALSPKIENRGYRRLHLNTWTMYHVGMDWIDDNGKFKHGTFFEPRMETGSETFFF